MAQEPFEFSHNERTKRARWQLTQPLEMSAEFLLVNSLVGLRDSKEFEFFTFEDNVLDVQFGNSHTKYHITELLSTLHRAVMEAVEHA